MSDPKEQRKRIEARKRRSLNAREEILQHLSTDYNGNRAESDRKIIVYRDRPSGLDWEGNRELTLARLQENLIGYHLVIHWSELFDSMANRIYGKGINSLLVDNSVSFGPYDAAQEMAERLPRTDVVSVDQVDPRQCANFEAAVVPARAVIAQTGTLVFAGASREHLAASLLPRTQFAFTTSRLVVPDFGAWIDAEAHNRDLHTVLVSGPSRTADIEKQVVVGVHGPWKLSLFIVQGR